MVKNEPKLSKLPFIIVGTKKDLKLQIIERNLQVQTKESELQTNLIGSSQGFDKVFARVPNEIWKNIFLFFDLKNLISVSGVCSNFRKIAKDLINSFSWLNFNPEYVATFEVFNLSFF